MSLGRTYLRRNGRWESRLSLGRLNGKRQSKSFYGSSREEAESKLIAAVLGNASVAETEMTVKELCDEWLSVSSHRVKLSTLANYRMKIEKHIIPQFGDMTCCEVTSKMAYSFMEKKLRAYLNEHNAPILLGITLALAMGLRFGEVCGLMRSDIDLKKRILTVNRSHSGVVRETQNDRQRFSQHFGAVAVKGQEHYL